MKKTIHVLIVGIFLSIVLLSCSNDKGKENLTNGYDIKLFGQLGNSPDAEILLLQNNGLVEGFFVYPLSRDTIKLDGKITDKTLVLYEYNSPEGFDRTGVFNGTFDENTYAGYWSENPSSKKVKFIFSTKRSDIVDIEVSENITVNVDDDLKYVRYEIVQDQEEDYLQTVFGIYKEKRFKLFDSDPWCYTIDTILDINLDGLDDAIITLGGACSGNAADPPISVVSFDLRRNKFIESEPIYSLGLEVVKEGNELRIHDNQSVGRITPETKRYSAKDVYALNTNGEIELLESNMIEIIKTDDEIWADDWYEESTNVDYERDWLIDLNNNKTLDTIRCNIWDRWMLLQCKICLDDGIERGDVLQGERIGITSTYTRGYKDIVIGNRKVKWNGNNYQ